jgi:uncharacterized membrane protein
MGARWRWVYLVCALAVTGLLCVVTPPFFVPDEAAQSLRAIALAHGHLLPEMPGEEAGAAIDTGAVAAMGAVDDVRMRWERQSADFHDRHYGPVSAAVERPLEQMRWSGKRAFIGFGNTAIYPPGFYLPAMVGWRVGEARGWTVFNSLRLARLLTAWAAVLLGWWALRLAGQGGWLLWPLLLGPSAVFLEAGCSQDALLLVSAALVVAVVARALRERRELRPFELSAAGVALALCAMARAPYLALGLLLFVPGLECRKLRWWRWPAVAWVAAASVCAAWWMVVARFGVDSADEADPAAQRLFLAAHPLAAASALLRGTAEGAWDFLHRGLYVIGWDDLLPHHGAALLLTVYLLAVALCAPGLGVRRAGSRALLAGAVLLPLLGVSLAEYMIWTPPGLRTVYGIQPRYWLPVLPAALLLVAALRRRSAAGAMRRAVLRIAGAGWVFAACSLPWFAAHAFYREGLIAVLRVNWP